MGHNMKSTVEVKEYGGEGIGGLLEAKEYACLFLNFLPRLVPEKVTSMQKHTETDETFVLLNGQAMLFLADGEEKPEHISCVKLEEGKSYTVPLGLWHAPVMSEDAKIFLVENIGTVDANSPRLPLTEEQMALVRELGKDFC